jgi:alpha-L-rhamnosidase
MLKTTILGASLALSLVVGATAAEPAVTGLRCEYRADPIGIDVTQPRLSWTIQSAERGEKQTAYELLVASSAQTLAKDQGDLWQTGKVASDQSVHVVYAGKPLESRAVCHWKVRIWGKDGKPSQWSNPAFWSMGLLKPEDWKAKWIGLEAENPILPVPPPGTQPLDACYLRREFKAEKKTQRATAYVSGLGLSEIYLNGQKVGDHVLSPGLTDYMKRVFYVTHDVTGYLKTGDNAVGAILGNGRFFAPRKSAGFFFIRDFGFPKLLLPRRSSATRTGKRPTRGRSAAITSSMAKITTHGWRCRDGINRGSRIPRGNQPRCLPLLVGCFVRR